MTLQEGEIRINDAKELANVVIQDFRANKKEASYDDLERLLGGKKLDDSVLKDKEAILKRLGVTVTVSRKARTYMVPDNADQSIERLIGMARNVWEKLSNSQGIIARLPELAENDWVEVKYFLSLLELGNGIQRSGDFASPKAAEEEVEKVVQELTHESSKVDKETQAVEQKKKNLERENYELFKDFLQNWIRDEYNSQETIDFEVIISGNQRGDSEWSTPDVTGVVVLRGSNIGIPIIRVFTIEVKFGLSLQAIAEAAAHRRFSHYSYVGVYPQHAWDENMAAELKAELASAGIGLICPVTAKSATLYEFLRPQFHHPDEEVLDDFLGYFHSEREQGHSLGSRVRDWCRRAQGQILAGE
jgi:predicted transcriptional regulator